MHNPRHFGSILSEIKSLKALEGVAGLPRVLGFSARPAAYLMTRHGTTTLDRLVAPGAKGQAIGEAQLARILVQLVTIVEDVHAAGYLHNDLYEDQVAVTFDGAEVEVTLLDLGYVTAIGGRPFKAHAAKCKTAQDLKLLME